jgi:hygromycin-B 7''-O-kinase
MYLDDTPGLHDMWGAAVLVIADITDEHVLVSNQDGNWNIVGLIDFGDAFLGHEEYELVAPGTDIARGDPALVRAMLMAAGYAERRLDETFRRRLMCWTLLHRYVKLADLLKAIPGSRDARNLNEFARALWPICPR